MKIMVIGTASHVQCLDARGWSCDFLLSDEGKAAIVQLHVEGIKAYVESLN